MRQNLANLDYARLLRNIRGEQHERNKHWANNRLEEQMIGVNKTWGDGIEFAMVEFADRLRSTTSLLSGRDGLGAECRVDHTL